jgi:signal transduction histidine kinase
MAQTMIIDSLREQVYAANTDDEKLKAYVLLFEEHQSINRDSLDEYGPVVKALAERSNNKRLQSLAQLAYANWYYRWGWSDSALVFIEPELEKNPVVNPDTRAIFFKLARAKALYLGSKSRYAEALDVLYQLLPEAEKYKDTLNIGLTCNTIGSVALGRSLPNEALKWIRRAIQLSENKPSFYEVLAPAYLNAGNAFSQSGNNDSAVFYIQKALPLCKAIENLNYTATGLRILSNVYTQTGNIKDAEAALLEMMEVRKKTSPASILVEDNLQLANFYASSGQLEKAIEICRQNLKQGALTDAKGDSNATFTNDPKLRLTYLEALAGFYKQAGRTDAYLSSLEELVAAKDSFYEANSAQIIGELQTQYDVKNKENTILKQQYDIQKKNFLFYGTVALAVFLTLAALFKFRSYRKQQQKKADEMVEEERRHSLAAVKNAEEKERVRIASDLHDNLGAYAASLAANAGYLHLPDADTDTQLALQELHKNAAAIIAQLNDTIWVLKKEALPLTAISDRIKKFIQQIGASYRDITLDVQEELEVDIQLPSSHAFHLYRVLQEAINNALKHSKGSNIQVVFFAKNGTWKVWVKDDGIGNVGVVSEDTKHGITETRARFVETRARFMETRARFVETRARFVETRTTAGNGLQNMKERCKEAGWDILWEAQKGAGTLVSITPTTN